MKTKQTLSEKLEEFQNQSSEVKSSLTQLMEQVSKKGLLKKKEYSLPMKDTIGRTLFNQRISS